MNNRASETYKNAITSCPSCEGFGWFEDDDGAAQDCDWWFELEYVTLEIPEGTTGG
jgi:hypothetical protein